MLARLLLLSLTLTGQGQASMGGSWVGPHRYMQAYRFMPGKWPGNMPRITPMQRSIIGHILGNVLTNILGVMPKNSLPGILRLKNQKSILEDVPEEGDSIGKF